MNDADYLDRPRFPDVDNYVGIKVPEAIFPAEEFLTIVADAGKVRQSPKAFMKLDPEALGGVRVVFSDVSCRSLLACGVRRKCRFTSSPWPGGAPQSSPEVRRTLHRHPATRRAPPVQRLSPVLPSVVETLRRAPAPGVREASRLANNLAGRLVAARLYATLQESIKLRGQRDVDGGSVSRHV